MNAKLHTEYVDVERRLTELGLKQKDLLIAVKRGWLAYATCTANHPPLIPSVLAWGETVRALREYLLPEGWRRCDDGNYSLVVNADDTMAIAVTTADDGAGVASRSPRTKNAKGPSTFGAIATNQAQLQLGLFEPDELPAPAKPIDPSGKRLTWMLLVYRAQTEIRCELALPASVAGDNHVDDWAERILLGSIPLDGDPIVDVEPPLLPDLDIDVKRRA